MARNLHPKVQFHLPEAQLAILRSQVPEGMTMTDLMVTIVNRYLEEGPKAKAARVLKLKAAVQELIKEIS